MHYLFRWLHLFRILFQTVMELLSLFMGQISTLVNSQRTRLSITHAPKVPTPLPSVASLTQPKDFCLHIYDTTAPPTPPTRINSEYGLQTVMPVKRSIQAHPGRHHVVKCTTLTRFKVAGQFQMRISHRITRGIVCVHVYRFD